MKDLFYYTNTIDSLNFITLYDFDAQHTAGSNINDILLFLDGMGKTHEVEISSLSDFTHFFKFSAIPQNDSLQFEITGRITGGEQFCRKNRTCYSELISDQYLGKVFLICVENYQVSYEL